MNAKRAAALLVVTIVPMLCVSPVNADELDPGFSDPTPAPLAAPSTPSGLYLVTDVYAGDVVASSGYTTTYSTVTVADRPGTYARVIDIVGSGAASEFDDRSFNGRARLSDGRSIAGTYYEDFVLTATGFVAVNIVFFEDDSETRDSARRSSPPPSEPTPGTRTRPPASSPASSVGPRPAPSRAPLNEPDPLPRVPAATTQPRTAIATAGVALSPDGPVVGSIEILRGRTIVVWPRAFSDGVRVPIRSWRLVSGSADLLSPLAGSAAEGCTAAWLSLPPGGAPSVLRFEVTSDALPGRMMTASVSVTVRSPALQQ